MSRFQPILAVLLLGLAFGPAAGLAAEPAKDSQAKTVPADEVRRAKDQFSAQRDGILAERQRLLEQLKTATEEERAAILEKLKQQEKDLREFHRTRGKQLRDEFRKQRRTTPAPTSPGR